jgi:site-specific DNA-methyltransferase (adenine-specific)
MNKPKVAGTWLSSYQDWSTPQPLFDELNKEFGFTIDVCASPWNAKLNHYFSQETDGLSQSWAGHICWMNPPYATAADWVKKAYEESLKGVTVVALIPARTDTRYFHAYIYGKAELRFLKGRVKFSREDGHCGSSTFPSMLVIWRPQ